MTGYERIPGSARRYKDLSTGEEISYRKYLTIKHGETPEQRAARPSAKNMSTYKRMVQSYKKAEAARTGKKPSEIKVKGKSASANKFKAAYKNFKQSKDNSAKGKKAKALELFGLRQPEWEWAVGDTPGGTEH